MSEARSCSKFSRQMLKGHLTPKVGQDIDWPGFDEPSRWGGEPPGTTRGTGQVRPHHTPFARNARIVASRRASSRLSRRTLDTNRPLPVLSTWLG
jgi:hypothetical protein